MATAINAIDYRHPLALTESRGKPYERLRVRAEDDAQVDDEPVTRELHQPDARWFTMPQAAEHLGIRYGSFHSAMSGAELDYYGIRFRSRSLRKTNARRGCGVLFDRRDLDDVVNLREALGCSLSNALRVFQAMRKGLIRVEFVSE